MVAVFSFCSEARIKSRFIRDDPSRSLSLYICVSLSKVTKRTNDSGTRSRLDSLLVGSSLSANGGVSKKGGNGLESMREKKRRGRFLLASLVNPLTANIYIYIYSERVDHEERERYTKVNIPV